MGEKEGYYELMNGGLYLLLRSSNDPSNASLSFSTSPLNVKHMDNIPAQLADTIKKPYFNFFFLFF